MNLETESIKFAFEDDKFTGQFSQLTQVSLAWEQRNRACWADSISLLHNGQNPEMFRPRQRKNPDLWGDIEMPNCFPEGGLTVLSRALTNFLIINHAHSNVVRAFHSERTSFVAYPNKLIVEKSKADGDLEYSCSLVG